MPAINNPEDRINNPNLQSIVRSALINFAQEVIRNEPPIIAPNTGYLGYNKRIALSLRILKNIENEPELVNRACWCIIHNFEQIIDDISTLNYRYFIVDNPSGKNVFENELSSANGFNSAVGYDKQIYSLLAGCTPQDFI